jgi:hypothetical protein
MEKREGKGRALEYKIARLLYFLAIDYTYPSIVIHIQVILLIIFDGSLGIARSKGKMWGILDRIMG